MLLWVKRKLHRRRSAKEKTVSRLYPSVVFIDVARARAESAAMHAAQLGRSALTFLPIRALESSNAVMGSGPKNYFFKSFDERLMSSKMPRNVPGGISRACMGDRRTSSVRMFKERMASYLSHKTKTKALQNFGKTLRFNRRHFRHTACWKRQHGASLEELDTEQSRRIQSCYLWGSLSHDLSEILHRAG